MNKRGSYRDTWHPTLRALRGAAMRRARGCGRLDVQEYTPVMRAAAVYLCRPRCRLYFVLSYANYATMYTMHPCYTRNSPLYPLASLPHTIHKLSSASI